MGVARVGGAAPAGRGGRPGRASAVRGRAAVPERLPATRRRSRYGWLTPARATRLLAHHHGLIPTERVLAPLPASRDVARREAHPLLDGLVLVRPPPPPGPGNTPAEGGTDDRPTLTFNGPTWVALGVLRGAGAQLMKPVKIESATGLSKQTVDGMVADLIVRRLASRPLGKRKGVILTADGVAVVDRIRNSYADNR